MPSHVRLSDEEKILVALAAAMGAGCRTCAERLSAMAAQASVPGHAVDVALAEGLRARDAATDAMRAKAAALLGHPPGGPAGSGEPPHVGELCRLAGAAAANSAPDALRYAEAARAAGASEAAIDVAVGIARSVRSKAQVFSDEELGAAAGPAMPCPTDASEPAEAAPERPGAGRAPCACE